MEWGNKVSCATSALYVVFSICSPLSLFSFCFFCPGVLVQAVVLQTQFSLPEMQCQLPVLGVTELETMA